MIDKYRLDDLRLESGEKGELARWVIQLQIDLDNERRNVVALEAAEKRIAGIDRDVRNIIELLVANEWAEHCTHTDLGKRLEVEITRLIGMRGDLCAAGAKQMRECKA